MIAIILGTRAELIKLFPIMKELDSRKIKYKFMHTGQHNLGYFPEMLGVKEPDMVLTKPPEGATTKFWSSKIRALLWNLFIVPKIWLALRKIRGLKNVVYHGDTMTTMSAAVASSKFLNPFKKWENVHLEAGLRSGSLKEPFPEEISRRFCDLFSDILFAVSKDSEKQLGKEKRVGRIINVGNSVVDSTLMAYELAEEHAKEAGYMAPKEKYALMTCHRLENIKSKERMEKIIDIITEIPITIVWPMHDNTAKQLEKFGLLHKVMEAENIQIEKEVGYLEFVWLLKHCTLVLTDGGGVQEESLVFRKPCLLLRMRTERTEGLKTGINWLTRLDKNYALRIVENILSSEWKTPRFRNPYGSKGVSKKIVDELIRK